MTKTELFEKRLTQFQDAQAKKRVLEQAKARKRRNALARKRYRAQRRRQIPLLLEMIKHSQAYGRPTGNRLVSGV